MPTKLPREKRNALVNTTRLGRSLAQPHLSFRNFPSIRHVAFCLFRRRQAGLDETAYSDVHGSFFALRRSANTSFAHSRLTVIPYGSLKSPLCSCVSITLPASL